MKSTDIVYILENISKLAAVNELEISAVIKDLSRLIVCCEDDISLITTELVKISAADTTLVPLITAELVKISAINPTAILPIVTRLRKISGITPEIIADLIIQIRKSLAHYPLYMNSLVDSISDGQILSKEWMKEVMPHRDLGIIYVCGGWFSMFLLGSKFQYERCISIDIDPVCAPISKMIHQKLVVDNWKFLAVTEDIHDLNYQIDTFTITRSNGTSIDLSFSPDTIINTSCEHIENFSDWWSKIPSGKLVILQTNNGFDIPTHVNCVQDLDEFEQQTPMANVHYSGSREMPKFTRFMRIGIK